MRYERAFLHLLKYVLTVDYKGSGSNAVKASAYLENLMTSLHEIDAASHHDRPALVARHYPKATAAEYALGIFPASKLLVDFLRRNLTVVTPLELGKQRAAYYKLTCNGPFEAAKTVARHQKLTAEMRRAAKSCNVDFNEADAVITFLAMIEPSGRMYASESSYENAFAKLRDAASTPLQRRSLGRPSGHRRVSPRRRPFLRPRSWTSASSHRTSS